MSSLSVLFSQHLLGLPHFNDLIKQKQKQAKQLQELIQPIICGLQYRTFSTSFHAWIALPPSFNSKEVAEQLKQKQILITGSHECSPEGNTSFIRIALSGKKEDAVLQSTVYEIVQMLS